MFRPEVAEAILMRIANGESLRSICKDEEMPSRQMVLRWLWGESQEAIDYGFVAKYARARESQGDFMDDRILEVADNSTPESAPADRVKILAYQWRAAKLRPKVYGDTLKLGGDGGEPIKVEAGPAPPETLARALLAIVAKAETDAS